MKAYHDFLRAILANGEHRVDRTAVGTTAIFGYQMRFDLQAGFPLVTTKRVHVKSVVEELLWFLRGETNIRSLQEAGVRIWNEWANAEGELGPVYGRQWRSWRNAKGEQIDQISKLIEHLCENPQSRRHLVCAWNVGELSEMALPPCHLLFQFYVSNDKRLSCQLYQRSADAFLGVPFNIASYSLLTHMVAQQVGLGVGEFVWVGGDCHIYDNHREQVDIQLTRTPYPLPTLELLPAPDLFSYQSKDVLIHNYQHHPKLTGVVAV